MKRHVDPDVTLLAALADPVRLNIVRQLAECDGICACDFTDSCDVSQPTVSHHLKVLREAGVVNSEKRGSQVYYRLAPPAIGRLAAMASALVPGDIVPAGDIVRGARATERLSPRDSPARP